MIEESDGAEAQRSRWGAIGLRHPTEHDVPETFGYALKRRLLGPPMVNEQLRTERLSRPLALGVLSSDGISSAAYGPEEILIELVAFFGAAAYTLVLPVTGLVLLGVGLIVLSYREVVTAYTKAGGSYVVARENFGPRFAQVAAVALLIDYVVTVAVQIAAGSAAIVSAFPALGPDALTIISVVVILIICYANLRGLREAGKTFAIPTYVFSVSVIVMILTGLYREAFGGGVPRVPVGTGILPLGHHSLLFSVGVIYVLARSFANGGSSLTGIEAVSNAVSALRPPEGRNARHVLVAQGSIVAFLIAGISWFAHITHATPYSSGYPTVLAQEAKVIFGHSIVGQVMFFAVQAGTAAILFTGGNTSFSGFPFLASFVAEDSFLPRWLTKRGHRLVFSNGIIVLTVVSLVLGLVTRFRVNGLVPFYAIGVFTGFAIAGFGMARYHRRNKERSWRRRLVINTAGGVYAALVVLIQAVFKFTEGAWLIVIVFPALVYALIRLNQQYRMEAGVLENLGGRKPAVPPNYSRRTVLVFVDGFDLATIAALRYARSLKPTALRAVHFVLDEDRADRLRGQWTQADRGVPLEFVETPDRRITRAAAELVSREASIPGTYVTVVLPRRSYAPVTGRLLHDHTADKIARVISRIPDSAATIIPFDVQDRLEVLHRRQDRKLARPGAPAPPGAPEEPPPPGVSPIGSLTQGGRATVQGRVRRIEIRPVEHSTLLVCEIQDATGRLIALFYGREHIPGVDCGATIRLRGPVAMRDGTPSMSNPAYELVA